MILSVVILSYNRPAQLKRILKKLENFISIEFEVIVLDDKSPKKVEIVEICNSFNFSFNFSFIYNDVNLGYDLNLLKAFNISHGDYVLLLSDDDYIEAQNLPLLISYLKNSVDEVIFMPYFEFGRFNRINIKPYAFNRISDVIYNSILFSGLIFKRVSVNKLILDYNFLKSCIYSQVYLSVMLIISQKQFGIAPSNILYVGGDGENFFGLNNSAINSLILSDRKSINANLNYQQFLIKVVQKLSNTIDDRIYSYFWRTYRLRLIGYGFRVRALGFKAYLSFLRYYFSASIERSRITSFVYLILIFTPGILSSFIYKLNFKYLKKSG
jgi:glycosyltransferase involved in cell wall biosynthesis